jgi:hypothetical protein
VARDLIRGRLEICGTGLQKRFAGCIHYLGDLRTIQKKHELTPPRDDMLLTCNTAPSEKVFASPVCASPNGSELLAAALAAFGLTIVVRADVAATAFFPAAAAEVAGADDEEDDEPPPPSLLVLAFFAAGW